MQLRHKVTYCKTWRRFKLGDGMQQCMSDLKIYQLFDRSLVPLCYCLLDGTTSATLFPISQGLSGSSVGNQHLAGT